MQDLWEVQVKGDRETQFEISVVRKSYLLGHRSWGWFEEGRKLMISSNTVPGWSTTEKIWNKLITVAKETAAELNLEEFGFGR